MWRLSEAKVADRETLRIAPSLELAVTWRREIRAGVERIWETGGAAERDPALPMAHGYRFDMRTGESDDAYGYRLAPAPRVAVDPMTGEASLVPCGRPRSGSSTVNKPSRGRKAQI